MTEQPVRRRRRRPVLTDAQVAALPRRATTYFHPDPELPRHGLRIHPTDRPASYTVIVRDIYKRQRWIKIGSTAEMTIAEAREIARTVIKRVEAGLEPFEPPAPEPASVAVVVTTWLERHVAKNKLRSARELRRVAEKYILPHWGRRRLTDIRRHDMASLLDHVEDAHGPAAADAVLKVARAMMHWHRDAVDEFFVPPTFPKTMRRIRVEDRARSRILTDGELARIWHATEAGGPFESFVRILLLTAQRRAKVRSMRWSDVDLKSGIWTIPRENREKGAPATLKLPAAAVEIIRAQPRFVSDESVFRGFHLSRAKGRLDEAAGVHDWRLHDARRTARSLMSRAGVRPDVAERCLGHAVGGVEGVYDRHSYADEMADALARLAALIERIVNPPAGNVVPLRLEAADAS